jgi:hypothetical protein
MSWTERFFLFVLFLVGGVFLYILTLFHSPTEISVAPPEEPELIMDNSPAPIPILPKKPQFRFSSSGFKSNPSSSLGFSGQSDGYFYDRREDYRGFNTDQKQIIMSGDSPFLDKASQKQNLREQLYSQGFRNIDFINMQQDALDNEEARAAIKQANNYVKSGNLDYAVELLERQLNNTPDSNYMVRSELLQEITQICLMSGNLANFRTYSQKYYQNYSMVIDIMKRSHLMQYPQAREKLYRLEQELNTANSGQFFHFLQGIQRGQISPTEIMVATKSNTLLHRQDSPFTVTTNDINKVAKTGTQLFKQIRR